jgi:hypothetical protein
VRKNKIGGKQGKRRSVKYTRFIRYGNLFTKISTKAETIDYSKKERPRLISSIDVSYDKDSQSFNVSVKGNSSWIKEVLK